VVLLFSLNHEIKTELGTEVNEPFLTGHESNLRDNRELRPSPNPSPAPSRSSSSFAPSPPPPPSLSPPYPDPDPSSHSSSRTTPAPMPLPLQRAAPSSHGASFGATQQAPRHRRQSRVAPSWTGGPGRGGHRARPRTGRGKPGVATAAEAPQSRRWVSWACEGVARRVTLHYHCLAWSPQEICLFIHFEGGPLKLRR
jgi:hypothetical protein